MQHSKLAVLEDGQLCALHRDISFNSFDTCSMQIPPKQQPAASKRIKLGSARPLEEYKPRKDIPDRMDLRRRCCLCRGLFDSSEPRLMPGRWMTEVEYQGVTNTSVLLLPRRLLT
eukprot:757064-Hanusia_phi.AAC.1